MKRERGGQAGGWILCVSLCLFLVGCAGRDPDAQRRQAVATTVSKLQNCAPGDEAEADVRLAVASVTRLANETSVRLVAQAVGWQVGFGGLIHSIGHQAHTGFIR